MLNALGWDLLTAINCTCLQQLTQLHFPKNIELKLQPEKLGQKVHFCNYINEIFIIITIKEKFICVCLACVQNEVNGVRTLPHVFIDFSQV